jgi:serine protease AprX
MAAGFFLLAVLHPLPTAPPGAATLDVLVQGEGAAAALAAAGGRPLAALPIVDGLLGRVPAGQAERLRRDRPRVRAVLDANRPLRLQGVAAAPPAAAAAVAGLPAAAAAVPGDAGRGVAVALLDTGIAASGDLAGRVVARADLSGEGSFTDSYGHGTFMAGLIAGDGSAGGPAGTAPGADLVDLKVAGADGATTLGQVLLAMQLADSSRERFGIRVLNISLGAPADDPATAPLTEAVERLWADGITVVAAAGNDGVVTAPGLDPYVVTVGALDPAATTDPVPAWSGRGPDFAGRPKPDLLAPGVDVVGLRAAGSTVDLANPAARVGDAYFRGSGTSMSTALVTGAAAAAAAAHADWGPGMVKAALAASAAANGGALDLDAALAAAPAAPANGDLFPLRSPGAAGEPDAPAFLGALDWRAGAFEGLRWALDGGVAAAAGPAAWEARPWLAGRWTGGAGTWAAQQWLARTWAARSWLAAGLDPTGWAALQWGWGAVAGVLASGAQMLLGVVARHWAGLDALARSWAARHWAELVWAARNWAARSWAGADWIARSWGARSWGARSWGLAGT